ncbi:MAG: dTDP-4-dehydrorhamnose 3,5-epimerase [bacterium]
MGLKLIVEHLNGLKLFEPAVYTDKRGFFMESYRTGELTRFGISEVFVQDNHSGSVKNTLRGMHFQWDKPQGKLIRVTRGEALVVEVDIRKKSSTFGKYQKLILSEENKNILWVPPGFANGFLALSDWCEMQYKCTAVYNPKGEASILWNDKQLGIDWECQNPIVSEKDNNAFTLSKWLEKSESESF